MTDTEAAASRVKIFNGKEYVTDAKGRHVPIELVKPIDKLQDDVIDKIIGYAAPLSEEIARFRQHSLDDIDAYVELALEQYGVNRGGAKGNVDLVSFDGCRKVSVDVSDLTTYSAAIHAAKELVDECLRGWSADSGPELRAIVERAFNVDQSGRFNRAELLSLLRLNIGDERWQRAMQAIRDAEQVIGSRRYVRIYQRPEPKGKWQPVTLNVASA